MREWNEKSDIVVTDCTTMFSVETAKKYEISAFCVTTEKGVFYQKKIRGSYSVVNVTAAGEIVIFKRAFVSAANQKYTCMIVYDEKTDENYLIDTRGEWYKLPHRDSELFLGPGQYDFSLDKSIGYYSVGDRDITLWKIRAMSQEAVVRYQAETAPDTLLSINKEFMKFFELDSFLKRDKYKYVYQTCGSNRQGRIVEWLIGKGLPYEIVPNIFEDDDTVNIRIQLNETSIERDDVQYLLARFKPRYSIFGISIEMFITEMNISMTQKHRYYSLLPSVNEAQEKMCRSILNTMRNLLEVKTDAKIFTEIFEKILSTVYFPDMFTQNSDYQRKVMRDIDLYKLQRKRNAEKERIQQYESELLAEMKDNGIVISRWVNETAMFSLVHSRYPDAIYQYRAQWLGKQSIDVYVPSLKVAFEYQGLQHFKPIEYFGGKEKFIELQERDARKLQRCKKNQIMVIYWNYDEPVSERVLRQKLVNAGINV